MIGVRLMYVSRCRGRMSPDAVRRLADQAARKNADLGVTGVLMKMGNYFFEVMEGPETAVTSLLRMISEDTRHDQLHVLHQEPASTPAFAKWSMGWMNLDAEYEVDLKGYRDLRELVRGINRDCATSKDGVMEVLTTLPGFLESRFRMRAEDRVQIQSRHERVCP